MKKTISIKQIMDNILDHPMLQDLTFERAIIYTLRLIKILGIPQIFERKSEIIHIIEYMGILPCDFYREVEVRDDCSKTVYDVSTGNFALDDRRQDLLKYKIQSNMIIVSSNSDIELIYDAISTDKDGYPLIMDDEAFINALEWYIKYRYFTVLFDQGKIPQQILENTKQEYSWAIGQASSSLKIPTMDEMEAISNMWTALLPRRNGHANSFTNLGDAEYFKTH